MTTKQSTVPVVMAFVWAAAPALAQQAAPAAGHCVTCTGPDATYTCAISGMTSAAAAGFQGQVLCIKSLAAEGHHASCTVNRRVSETCVGEVRTVIAEGGASAAPAAPPAQKTEAAPDTPPAESSSPEHATGPAEALKGGIAKVGDSINKAAGKTWSCVSSLFKDC